MVLEQCMKRFYDEGMADVSLLPGPNSDFWDWQLHSACRGLDSSNFYHPDGERGPARENRIARAKAICATCPVLTQCQEHAIKTRETYGVWGGLSEEERQQIFEMMDRKKRMIS